MTWAATWAFFLGCLIYGLVWPVSAWYAQLRGRARGFSQMPPLPDLTHDWLPRIPESWNRISHILAYTSAIGTLVWGGVWGEPWLADYIWYMTVLQMDRCLHFLITMLPDCRERRGGNAIPRFGELWFGATYDLLFSGHLTHFYAPIWFLFSRGVLSLKMFQWARGISLGMGLVILMTRSHYTIDLLVSIAASHMVYDYLFFVFRNTPEL